MLYDKLFLELYREHTFWENYCINHNYLIKKAYRKRN